MRLPFRIGLALALPIALSPSARTQAEDAASRPFRIPDHAAAKARMDRAEEHADAGRWSEALAELQGILEEHRGDLLPGERPRSRGGEPSLELVHPGAGRRARERLLGLPEEARAMYRERFGREAAAAFERARERADRSALGEVARRWPLTDAARSAWWALGDLELERGEDENARWAWSRALSATLGRNDLELTDAADWADVERALSGEAQTEGPPIPAGVRDAALQRVAHVRAALDAHPSSTTSTTSPISASELRFADALHPSIPASTSGSGRAAVRSPSRDHGQDLEAWPEPFALPPHPFIRRAESLFAARAGDAILVSTSLRLLALHAWSGAPLWDSGEPPGWEDLSALDRTKFLAGVDREASLVAPAAGGRVALAALQIPLTFVQSFIYPNGNLQVTTIIPDRRLFAFDLETGRALWNHAPPASWDGESGGFADRMSVAGPPIVRGSRVLAPYCRMQGRIDYHVGCFDLDTGALLWSTALISGQRELNMFGRPEHEFSAPPLVVQGDRVVALTQLGTVAALDLFTGEIQWETRYDQVPLPKNESGGFRATPRRPVWLNAPPVITDGVVVATPFDSETMVGIDLASGGLLWSASHRKISALVDRADVDLLVGARADTVLVAGTMVAAIAARSGLSISAPSTLRWKFADDEMRDGLTWRPVLAGDRLVIPLKEERVEIDVETGRALSSAPWALPGGSGSGGNLVLGPGEVTAVSSTHVSGWFDWDLLTQRARTEAAARPENLERALALGRLLSDRGSAEWQRGEIEPARTHLAEAEVVLARALEASGRDSKTDSAPAATELHRVLRSQARLRAGLADRAGAIDALRRARALAGDAATLRDTLLEELALVNGAVSPGEAADALSTLERCCSGLAITCEGARSDAGDPARPTFAGLPRFIPVVDAHTVEEQVLFEMPVGLFVLLERAAAAAEARDERAELTSLHEILARYPEVELPDGGSGRLASERIGRLVREGRAEGYDVFEARAEKLLDEALSSRDGKELAEVGALYPHSRAALQADDQRLAWAFEAGDTALVARIVQSQLPYQALGQAPGEAPGSSRSTARGFGLADASERQVRALLRLSTAFARSGNRELAAELLRHLAAAQGDVRSDLDGDGGRTLAELSAGIARWRPPDPAPPVGKFGAVSRTGQRTPGDWEILGRMSWMTENPGQEKSGTPPSYAAVRIESGRSARQAGTAVVTVLVGSDSPDADVEFAFEGVGVPLDPITLQSSTVPWSRRAALAPDRILVSSGSGVVALDAEGGRAWERDSDGALRSPISLACASGVAVLSVDLAAGRGYLLAVDARSGVELWRTQRPDPGLSPLPILSSSRVVLLPAPGRRGVRTLDLFTGRDATAFDLDSTVRPSVADDAWIEDDLLIVPWFQSARDPDSNHVIAYDLGTGRRAWRVAFGDATRKGGPAEAGSEGPELEADERELAAVLQRPGRTWLLVRPSIHGDEAAPSPAVYELSTRIGALTPLANVRVGPTDRVLGLARPGRLALSSSLLFLLGNREGSSEARLRAVDLQRGELWSWILRPKFDELLQAHVPYTLMPQPALSDEVVVLAYSLVPRPGVSSGGTTILESLERGSGRFMFSLSLTEAMGTTDAMKLLAFGHGLLVRGQKGLEVLR